MNTTPFSTPAEQSTEFEEIPLVCEFSAIDATQHNAHIANARHLFAGEQVRQELANGYIYTYPAEDYAIVTEFVANERLCCPFWHFTVEVTPNHGPIRLHMTGPEGAKLVLQTAINDFEKLVGQVIKQGDLTQVSPNMA